MSFVTDIFKKCRRDSIRDDCKPLRCSASAHNIDDLGAGSAAVESVYLINDPNWTPAVPL